MNFDVNLPKIVLVSRIRARRLNDHNSSFSSTYGGVELASESHKAVSKVNLESRCLSGWKERKIGFTP